MAEPKEVSVDPDVLKKSAVQELSDPPKFPLLKGEENKQILRRITQLTNENKIPWQKGYTTPDGRHFLMTASYLSLRLSIIWEKYPGGFIPFTDVTFLLHSKYSGEDNTIKNIERDRETNDDFQGLYMAIKNFFTRQNYPNMPASEFIWNVVKS